MIVLQFYPNGEFSQGVDTSTRRKSDRNSKLIKPTRITRECRDEYLRWAGSDQNADIHLCVPGQLFADIDGQHWEYICRDDQGNDRFKKLGFEYTDNNYDFGHPVGTLVGLGLLIPLVHQLVESSPDPVPSRKKLIGMTKSMARNIRQAVYILEHEKGKDVLSFLTLTLPNLSHEGLAKMCERWQDATDQLLKWLRKKVEKLGIEFQYVYCTEIQTKRLQNRSEYAPHLHIVYVGRHGKKSAWAISPKQVRKSWASIISNIVGDERFETGALENLQRIKFSAARYLSKYLSKGACCLPSIDTEACASRLHTQWGGMARKLSTAIKRYTRRITSGHRHEGLGVSILGRMAELVSVGIIQYWKAGFICLSRCEITGMDRGFSVGCGCLSVPVLEGGYDKLLQYVLGKCPIL